MIQRISPSGCHSESHAHAIVIQQRQIELSELNELLAELPFRKWQSASECWCEIHSRENRGILSLVRGKNFENNVLLLEVCLGASQVKN